MTRDPDVQSGVRPGDLLDGKYRVERVLGTGGMGVVVAAHHIHLDSRVALKFLLPEALENPEAVARFMREARAAVRITGEHVARVSDVGQLTSGAPYIVMEYLDGIDLSVWLTQRGPLPIELAVDFLLQTSEAIADAHALGIIHRDLKPANLFCVQRSDGQLCIKVLDFGISKVITPGASQHDMTRTNALIGSPYYMSPEQMHSSRSVDARTDIWSMGIILFELLSGQRPFQADAVTELAIKIAMDFTPSVRTFRADVPPGLEQVITTCLEKSRERRYQTVGELAYALHDFGSIQGRTSVERVLGTLRQAGIAVAVRSPSAPIHGGVRAPPVMMSGTDASWGQSGAATRPRGKAALAVGAVVTLAVLATGGALLHRKQTPATPAASAAAVLPATAAPPGSAPPAPSVVAAVAAPEPVTASPTVTSAAGRPAARPVAPTPRAATSARNPSSTPALPVTKTSCDPPYYFDARGARVFKEECL